MIFKNSINNKLGLLFLIAVISLFTSCSKGGDSPSPTPPPPTPVAEADIAFKVEIAGSEVNYTSVFAVVGNSVVMNANISSTLPKDGVTVDVIVKKKSDNSSVFSSNTSSTSASNAVTITGLVPGVLCVATVTVTSKSKSTNTLVKTFELASK